MAITFKNLIPGKYLENTQSAQYTSNAAITIIDKASITNVTSSNATFNINIVPSVGVVSNENLIIQEKVVTPSETYLLPELVGQILNEGDFISTLSSAVDTLSIRISGREIT